jgi:hypothetical protein
MPHSDIYWYHQKRQNEFLAFTATAERQKRCGKKSGKQHRQPPYEPVISKSSRYFGAEKQKSREKQDLDNVYADKAAPCDKKSDAIYQGVYRAAVFMYIAEKNVSTQHTPCSCNKALLVSVDVKLIKEGIPRIERHKEKCA